MLPRTLASVYRQIRDYTVLEIEGEVKGLAAYRYFGKTWQKFALSQFTLISLEKDLGKPL